MLCLKEVSLEETKDKEKGPCFHCEEMGHWKRNCPKYLETLMDKKNKEKVVAYEAGPSGLFYIENCFSITSHSWVFDTGSGTHLCNCLQGLSDRKNLQKGEMVLKMGNGSSVDAKSVGNFGLTLRDGHTLILTNCYFVPDLLCNIVSVSLLTRAGYNFVVKNDVMNMYLNDNLITSCESQNGVFVLNQNKLYSINVSLKRKSQEINLTQMWHCRLGHINLKRLDKLHSEGYIDLSKDRSFETCECCLKGKMTKSPFKAKGDRASALLELIHSDVCGPISTSTRDGCSYFITFTDDFSRYGYIYLMKYKSDALEKFKEYKVEVENQTGKSIKILRSDRGGEYVNADFQDYLKENGILAQLTPPYTPQHNGVAERRNRTLLDMVRSMMSKAELPISFWGYALESAVHILNRVPTKTVPLIPYEMWTGRKPSLNFIKIWGCPAYVKNINPAKLEAKSELCYFIGYPKHSKGFIFYHREEQKVFVSHHATFLEKEVLLKENGGRITLDECSTSGNNNQIEEPNDSITQTDPQPPRRSSRIPHPPERYYGFLVDGGSEDCVVDDTDPLSYQQAIQSKDSARWLEAMREEMDSMYTNKVWTLQPVPEGVKPVGSKWIFKRKIGVDGQVETYKARLVAKGFRQIPGIDYDETFSPVAMMKSIRILLAIAAYHDYEIWQMDVKTAFLNGNLEETVYMSQPEGFEISGSNNMACKLLRSIYGLKQASRSWNKCFDEKVKEFDFVQNEDEPCVYRKIKDNAIAFLVLYVDDILLIGNDIPLLQSIKVWLSSHFSMKDLGEASYILGVKIYRDRSKRMLGLSQSQYIDSVLKKFSMENSKRGNVPICPGITLSKGDCPKTDLEVADMKKIPYASAIGSIMYAMLCTRPDVAYALGVTSRYQSNPGENHWIAVKNILKYLRRTKDVFLIYGKGELLLEGFTDSGFQSDLDDSKSVSGYVFLLNGGAISWKSSKQSTVADSTMEAEYIAANDAAKEAVWMKKYISELGVVPSIVDPVTIYCDNNAAIALAKEPRSHKKS